MLVSQFYLSRDEIFAFVDEQIERLKKTLSAVPRWILTTHAGLNWVADTSTGLIWTAPNLKKNDSLPLPAYGDIKNLFEDRTFHFIPVI